jgi:pyrroline-5-carboxylate reductase
MREGLRLFFLGAGSMSEAMIKGILSADLLSAQHITVSNRQRPERLAYLHDTYGVQSCQDKRVGVAQADVLVVAVKPFNLADALREIAPAVTSHHLIISVVAGASTDSIAQCLGVEVPVIRSMPNTSSFVQESATALCPGRYANGEHMALAQELFAAIGSSAVVEEDLMNAVTGLSGTGPAYLYYVIEALMEGGRACGLPEDTCRMLMEQTVLGAAKMLRETAKDPAELRRQVTSPNGTTMAAMQLLDSGNCQELFVRAVRRATQRAEEMGNEITAALPVGARCHE